MIIYETDRAVSKLPTLVVANFLFAKRQSDSLVASDVSLTIERHKINTNINLTKNIVGSFL